MCSKLGLFVLAFLLSQALGRAVPLHHESPPELGRLGARLQSADPRLPLPLPSPQDLEAIRKVAQILVMLGEQVIPTIIGETGGGCDHVVPATVDVASDPVDSDF